MKIYNVYKGGDYQQAMTVEREYRKLAEDYYTKWVQRHANNPCTEVFGEIERRLKGVYERLMKHHSFLKYERSLAHNMMANCCSMTDWMKELATTWSLVDFAFLLYNYNAGTKTKPKWEPIIQLWGSDEHDFRKAHADDLKKLLEQNGFKDFYYDNRSDELECHEGKRVANYRKKVWDSIFSFTAATQSDNSLHREYLTYEVMCNIREKIKSGEIKCENTWGKDPWEM